MSSLFIALLVIYFFPSVIALLRGKSDALAIIALNMFLGWTLLGWVFSLVWALKSEPSAIILQSPNHSPLQPSGVANASASNLSSIRHFQPEEKDLSNDRFRLYLVQSYQITKNDVLGKFILGGNKIFDSLDEALREAAHMYECDLKNERIRSEAERARNLAQEENIRNAGRPALIALFVVAGVIVMAILGSIYYDH
jgi:hypothetical protein